MVMDVFGASQLMRSIMAARVVDLPDPVTPVTSTSPRGMSQICSTLLKKHGNRHGLRRRRLDGSVQRLSAARQRPAGASRHPTKIRV